MATIDEGAYPAGMIGPNLLGISTLSEGETIPFIRYVRHILPLDGYVFWLKAEATEVQGSVHVSADKQQNEDETIAINRIIFTTGTDVQAFNAIQPNEIWVGEISGVRFSFSRSGPRYKAAGLFHYVGDAVYPALESQLVNIGEELPSSELIVSNSLPAWLLLERYSPVWLLPRNPCITLFPSFAVPDNLRPPYGSVHIIPNETRALASTPTLARRMTHSQLAMDRVRITLYGLTNAQALSFFDLVNQFSIDTNTIGLMNMPIMRDEKRTQAELGILAMKKTIDFDVSYQQATIRDLARQLLLHAHVTYFPQSYGVA